MTNLGTVGASMDGTAGPQPTRASGTYFAWYAPNARTVIRDDGLRGPQPARLGRANGIVSVDEVTVIITQFGGHSGFTYIK